MLPMIGVVLTIICIFVDVLLFQKSHDIRFAVIIAFYVYLAKRFHVTAKITFLLCFILLCISYIFFVSSDVSYFLNPGPVVPHSERFAVWLYIFLVIGVI